MEILHLTLKKKWFDLIASGLKKYEYREKKPYWVKRLTEGADSGAINFDEIHFKNGYGIDSPFMRVEYHGAIEVLGAFHIPENGEVLDETKSYFKIMLGDILETRNYPKTI